MRGLTDEQHRWYQKIIVICGGAVVLLVCINIWLLIQLDQRCRTPGPPGPPPHPYVVRDVVEQEVYRSLQRHFADATGLKKMK